MLNSAIQLAAVDIKGQLDRIGESLDLDARLRHAMKQARDHFLLTDEDQQFRAAVGAVMLTYEADSPERQRIQREMKDLNRLSAMLNAAQAGLTVSAESLVDEAEPPYEPIGLLAMWRASGQGDHET